MRRVSSSEVRDTVLEGLGKLRTASLLQIITSILLVISLIIIILSPLPTIGAFARAPGSASALTVGLVTAGGVLMFIAIILLLVAVFAFLLPSVSRFALWRPADFSAASTLMKVGYIGGAVLLIIAIPLTFVGVGVVLLVIGSLIMFIGLIGNALYFAKLRDLFNTSAFLLAALFLFMLPIVAWIFSYVEAGSLANKIESGEVKL